MIPFRSAGPNRRSSESLSRFDRLPVQPEVISQVPDQHRRAQPRDALGQLLRHPRVPIERLEQLELRPAVRARDPESCNLKLHGVLEYRQNPLGQTLFRGHGRLPAS